MRLEKMADSKLLDYNKDKSGMIVFGNKKNQVKNLGRTEKKSCNVLQ